MASLTAGPAAALAAAGRRMARPWSDRRTEAVLACVACLVLAFIAGMVVFVFSAAWPSFRENGLAWFGSGGDITRQFGDIVTAPADAPVYTLRAFPLIWGTLLTTGGAVLGGLVFSTLAAIFIVEFAPPPVRRVLVPVVSLLAAIPSVIYGLIGILALAPILEGLISDDRRRSVAGIVQLGGDNWVLATFVLMLMIVPIMTAITATALGQVPRAWTEGAAALGVNRWRVMWTIAVRTARPAIIAGAVLATARALGEAIMLVMVSGGAAFAPNPLDGLTFFMEPTRPLAATIVVYREGVGAPAGQATVYAIAAVLLVSAMFLSLGAYVAKQPLRKYGIRS